MAGGGPFGQTYFGENIPWNPLVAAMQLMQQQVSVVGMDDCKKVDEYKPNYQTAKKYRHQKQDRTTRSQGPLGEQMVTTVQTKPYISKQKKQKALQMKSKIEEDLKSERSANKSVIKNPESPAQ